MSQQKYIIDFEIIWKKINDSLSAEEEYALEQWLNEKDEHREYLENAINYYKVGSSFDNRSLDVQKVWENVEVQLTPIIQTKQTRWGSFVKFGTAIAAVVIFILIIFNVFDSSKLDTRNIASHEVIKPGKSKATLILDDGSQYNLNEDGNVNIESGGVKIKSNGNSLSYNKESSKPAGPKFNILITPSGGEFLLELSDGTKVWVNNESTLKYPIQFVGNERIVELVGEAYFEVAHDTSKPFRVISGNQSIDVLGTKFNITSYEDDEFVITTLVEGKVNVYQTHARQNAQILLPNRQSIMNKRSGKIVTKIVDSNQFTAWKDGKFYFREQSLSNIMKVLMRWYDIDVFIDNNEIGNLKFTGSFKRYENFEHAMNLIEKTEVVNFIIEGNIVIVKSK